MADDEVSLRDLLALLDEARALVVEAKAIEVEPVICFDTMRRLLRRALRMFGNDEISDLCRDVRAVMRHIEADIPAAGPLPQTVLRLACSVLNEKQVAQKAAT